MDGIANNMLSHRTYARHLEMATLLRTIELALQLCQIKGTSVRILNRVTALAIVRDLFTVRDVIQAKSWMYDAPEHPSWPRTDKYQLPVSPYENTTITDELYGTSTADLLYKNMNRISNDARVLLNKRSGNAAIASRSSTPDKSGDQLLYEAYIRSGAMLFLAEQAAVAALNTAYLMYSDTRACCHTPVYTPIKELERMSNVTIPRCRALASSYYQRIDTAGDVARLSGYPRDPYISWHINDPESWWLDEVWNVLRAMDAIGYATRLLYDEPLYSSIKPTQ